MTSAPQNASATSNRPAVPRAKLWIFFALFSIVAASMYAGTWYRIQHYGFTGTGADQLAHPEGKKQDDQSQPAPGQN